MTGKVSINWNKWSAALLLNVYTISFCMPLYAGGYHSNGNGDTNIRYHRDSNASGYSGSNGFSKIKGVQVPEPISKGKQENVKPAEILLQKGFRISGPSQPEMSSFKSVGVDNMVNQFTGDFSYNIPLLDVGGYPVNIFYNAGISMDQEASWVGLGWNLNPGTISRTMRGLPDDFNGGKDVITKETDIRDNIDAGIKLDPKALEMFGYKNNKFNVNGGISYNNYTGFGLDVGASISGNLLKGVTDEKTNTVIGQKRIGDINAAISFSSKSGLSFNPSLNLWLTKFDKNGNLGALSTSASYNSRSGLNGFQLDLTRTYNFKDNTSLKDYSRIPVSGGFTLNFANNATTPSIRMPITNRNFRLNLQIGNELLPKFKTDISLEGYYSQSFISENDRRITKPAFGYLNMQNAEGKEDALLDFNRLNDGGYVEGKTTVLSMPQYTYDVFSINGEGTGGSFRAYRGDIGYVHDAYNASKSIMGSGGLDFGKSPAGNLNVGINLNGTSSKSFVSEWVHQNNTKEGVYFRKPVGAEESVYFRNPGETTSSTEGYYQNIGNDNLVRIELNKNNSPFLPFPEATTNLLYYNDGGNGQPVKDAAGQQIKLSLPAALSDKALNRDKRSQVISYLTAKEAARVGFDIKIRAYNDLDQNHPFSAGNAFTEIDRTYNTGNSTVENYRQPNHISEIDVVEQDGKRYVYGLPVYNIIQKDVTFAVAKSAGDKPNDLVSYNNNDNNLTGARKDLDSKDRYYNAEIIPAYAHSFLLTALVSPDYSDITGDGISDDDMGTAVKFNYKRVGLNPVTGKWEPYKWRTPAENTLNKATYNEGLKTDKSDDKAFYSYGEKELWYTHSIESKSMVAIFTTKDRDDGLPVTDENGGVNENSLAKLQMLEKIDLYSKADLIKNHDKAKPIKTVHFVYTDAGSTNKYSLCEGVSNSKLNPSTSKRFGKLTLKGIYFTYNGAGTSQKHKYVFRYNEGYNNHKFDYNRTNHDVWGNLKSKYYTDATTTTETSIYPKDIVTSSDFPFALQVSTSNKISAEYISKKAAIDAFARAWNLSEVDLPSGATIKVNYESDEYAFVQNRSAAQMMQIAGFSNKTSAPDSKLYGLLGDYKYVFFNVPDPISNYGNSQAEINKKYLSDINQLLLKLYVKVPKDPYGSGYEPVTVYSKMAGSTGNYTCGLVSNNVNGHPQIWIQLAENSNKECSVVESVFQFLRDNLSSKVFFGSDVGMDAGPIQVIKSLVGMIGSMTELGGQSAKFRTLGYGKQIDIERSFGRLSNPMGVKFGGGHRVKSIIIKDNWNLLTSRGANGSNSVPVPEATSTYGQEYDYTTTIEESGLKKTISSGVATYEPSGAGEENPFREMIQYKTTQFMGPSSFGSVELPVAESFYPAAMVGYSKVRVKSINNKNTLNKNIKGGVGVQETEYFTTKDFPTLCDYTPLDDNSHYNYSPQEINFFLKFWSVRFNTLSQGFRVQLNNMNGKIKQQSSYPENDPDHPLQYTKYFYKQDVGINNQVKLNNKVDVVKDATGVVSPQTTIGKDIELMIDFREHNATSYSGDLKVNVEFKWPPAIFFPSFYIPFSFDQNKFRSVTVSKIINTYGILERVETFDKGSKVNTDNLVYEAESGEPLVTSATNSFNKPVYSFSYPAHWAYDGMGPAYKNIGVQYEHVFIRNGFIESSFVDQNLLQSGDEIYVEDAQITGVPDNSFCSGASCVLKPKSTSSKVWALDLSKSKDPAYTGVRRIILLERDGKPYNGGDVYMRIIRSGRRNLLGSSVGGVSSLVNPVVDNGSGLIKIAFGANNILNASAARFKEEWMTDDAFYVSTIPSNSTVYAPLRTRILYPTGSHSLWDGASLNKHNHDYDVDYFGARNDGRYNLSKGYYERVHGIDYLKFDMSSIPSDATIVDGKLSLYAHGTGFQEFFEHQSGLLTFPYHGDSDPHFFSGYINNAVLLRRVKETWPDPSLSVSAKDVLWDNLFNRNLLDGSTGVLFNNGGTPLSNNTSLINQSGVKDDRLNITNMVKEMFYWNKPPYNITPSMRMELLIPDDAESETESGQTKRVCFNSGVGRSDLTKSFMEVSYYSCSDVVSTIPNVPYITCSTTQNQITCNSVFTKNQFNPYVYGLLGDWRAFKSYTFFDDRNESDVNGKPNPSSDGTLKEFTPYWTAYNPSKNAIEPTTSAKWVWNSAIAQVNKRGMEIENYDPLGRYNAGVYGYNQSLPVAVVNNAHYCESAFDGFEDYTFSDEFIAGACKPQRHFDLGPTTLSKISDQEHHTGKYSLKTEPNTTHTVTVPLKFYDGSDPLLKLVVPTALTTVVNLKGKGLTGYWNGNPSNKVNNCYPVIDIAGHYKGGVCHCHITDNDNIGNIPVDKNSFNVKWHGFVQVDKTAIYNLKFHAFANNDNGSQFLSTIKIKDGVNTIVDMDFSTGSSPKSASPSLVAGKYYEIIIDFSKQSGAAQLNLQWKRPCDNEFVPIENKYLYDFELPHDPEPSPTLAACSPGDIKMTGNILTDRFTPIPGNESTSGSKLIFSAWVKESGAGSQTVKYDNNSVEISFLDINNTILASTGSTPITPVGIIIEGWQRYEFELPAIPQGAVNMKVQLKNTSTGPVYFDDIRMHPFNANMKSFVYDPGNLRLRAELDENNYASFYEYDDEGTLIRVKKETKEGIKTIQETRSALRQNQ